KIGSSCRVISEQWKACSRKTSQCHHQKVARSNSQKLKWRRVMNRTTSALSLPVKTALAAILMATLAPGASRAADQGGVQAGMLTCQVASGWGFIFGSTKDLKCVFSSKPGVEDHYTGSIGRYGVDI